MKTEKDFRLENVLAPFRSLESNEDALIVLGDDEAMRVLIAWQHIDQEWAHPGGKQPLAIHGKMAKLWTWIMSGWEVDNRKVSRLAGVSPSIAHAKLEILMGNRLIYPDGSMSKGVRTALMAHTATKLGIKQKPVAPPLPTKTKKKEEPEEKDDDTN